MPDCNFASPHYLPAPDGFLEEIRPRSSFPACRPAGQAMLIPRKTFNPNSTKTPLKRKPQEEPPPSLSPARHPIVRRQPRPNRTGGNFENQSIRMATSLSRSLRDGSVAERRFSLTKEVWIQVNERIDMILDAPHRSDIIENIHDLYCKTNAKSNKR